MAKRIIIFKSFRFIFSFIVTFMLVTCQILPCFVFAEAIPVGQPVSASSLWTVIEGGGPEEQLVRDPFLMTVESMTTFGLGTLAAQSFWDETNAEIAQKIQDGTLSNTDVGSVIYKEVDGQQVPVAIKNTIYGQNMYFITDDLAEQIRQQNLQTDAAISAACMDYWERVIVSDIEPFQQAAEAAENWVTSFPDLAVQTQSLISEVMYNLFGEEEEIDPESTFFVNGTWLKYRTSSSASFTERKIDVATIENFDSDSFVIARSATELRGRPIFRFGLYAHKIVETDPLALYKITDFYIYTDNYYEVLGNGIPIVDTDLLASGAPVNILYTDLFESWPEIVALPNAQPLILPNVHYNVGNITGAVNDICAAADAALAAQTSPGGSPEFTPETRPEIVPSELPDLLPEPYEVPWPDSFPSGFPDPDPWLDPDSNPWPDPVPDPGDDPGGDDPGGDDPGGDDSGDDDNDWDDEPPERPRLRAPVLLTLFPFCIPFDIKRSIEWFGVVNDEETNGNNESISANYITGVYNDMSASEVEEINGNGMEPVFAIPLNLGVAGQQVLNTVIILDLTEYGIPVLVQYLKTVQIIAWIIVLGVATYRFIY